MEQIIFWAVVIFIGLTVIGAIAQFVEKRNEKKQRPVQAAPPSTPHEALGAALAAAHARRVADEDADEPALEADVAPLYYFWWVLAADRTGANREKVLQAVGDTVLPEGASRDAGHESEQYWEVTFPAGWDRDLFIQKVLIDQADTLPEQRREQLVEGALIIALLHDADGNKYMVDKTAYGRERAKMVSEIRGLCLDWYGSKGEALFEAKLALAEERAQAVAPQFGYSVGPAQ